MKLVVIESPYRSYTAFELERNLAYARALVEHITLRGDSPVASHLLITQSLDDRLPEHRKLGMQAGLHLLRVADIHAFGVDLGMSDGMRAALAHAKELAECTPDVPAVEEISLPEWADAMRDDAQLRALVFKYQPKWHVHSR